MFKTGDQVTFEQDVQFLGTHTTKGTVIMREHADIVGEECNHSADHEDPANPPPSYLVQPNDPLAKSFMFCECELEAADADRG